MSGETQQQGRRFPPGRGGPPDLRPVTLSAAAASWHFIRRCPPTNVSSRPRLRTKTPLNSGGNSSATLRRGGVGGIRGWRVLQSHVGSPPPGLSSTRKFAPLTRVSARAGRALASPSAHIRRNAGKSSGVGASRLPGGELQRAGSTHQ